MRQAWQRLTCKVSGLPSGQRFSELILLMVPAYLANMAPPFLRYWHGPNPPISRKWLGDHKTYGGFLIGALAGLLAARLIFGLPGGSDSNSSLYPIAPYWFWFGISMGLAALVGDSLKSFFKRRIGIASGAPWIPFDQLDFIVAALLVLSCWMPLGWLEAVLIMLLSFVGDVLINQVSYRLGIKRDPW